MRKKMDEAKALGEEARDRAWQKWKDARRAYVEEVEDVANQELTYGENVLVPNGRYTIDIEFPKRKEGKLIEFISKKIEIYDQMVDANLSKLIKQTWGEIVNLGIHNFGFAVPDEGYRMDTCSYTLHGPKKFAYHSSILIDASGHAVRRADVGPIAVLVKIGKFDIGAVYLNESERFG